MKGKVLYLFYKQLQSLGVSSHVGRIVIRRFDIEWRTGSGGS
jgi:hypothetical protein